MRRLAVVAIATLLLAGCSSDAPPVDDGLGVPLPQPIEPGAGGEVTPILLTSPFAEIEDATTVDGELVINVFGCVAVGDRLLVAPLGSTVDGQVISIAGYGSSSIGDAVSFAGGMSDDVPIADLGDEFAFCVPGDDTTADLAYIAPKGR